MTPQYTTQFNADVVKDLQKLNEKIEEAESAEEVAKLRLAKLYRGMELATGYNNRFNKLF